MSRQSTDTDDARRQALLRDTLDRVGDKWTMQVIQRLDLDGVLRFTQLRDRLDGVSQKMLTRTLRSLERDGLVSRRVFPVVPPHVEYALTPLGRALAEAVCVLWEWVEQNVDAVESSRRGFDEAAPGAPASSAPTDAGERGAVPLLRSE